MSACPSSPGTAGYVQQAHSRASEQPVAWARKASHDDLNLKRFLFPTVTLRPELILAAGSLLGMSEVGPHLHMSPAAHYISAMRAFGIQFTTPRGPTRHTSYQDLRRRLQMNGCPCFFPCRLLASW